MSIDLNSGGSYWNYQANGPNKLSLIAATAGNGLVAKTTDVGGTDTITHLDASGNSAIDPVVGSQLDYFGNNVVIGAAGTNALTATVSTPIEEGWAQGTRGRGDAQHNGTTDPGFKVVGVRDCSNKTMISGVTTYERFPIYELWDKNRAQPTDHYTVFEYVVDRNGNITDFTRCGNGSNTGLTPCDYADGQTIGFNVFKDDLAIGISSEARLRQYFQYGLPGQRKWGAQIYRTPPVGIGPPQQMPNARLDLHLALQAEPLINEQHSPYMGPWFNSNVSYRKCETDNPLTY